MGVETKIEWCHHTWSSWRGCTKISHGCTNCYAEALSHRNPAVLGEWGPNGTRVIAKDWTKPLAWDRAAAKAGERRRIFMSMNDWLEDRPELDEPRGRLLELINSTPNLSWLLLSKRPENWSAMLHRLALGFAGRAGKSLADLWLQGNPPPNVWLGVSVEDQATADARIPALLDIPAALRWVSYEPALGPVDFRRWLPEYVDDYPHGPVVKGEPEEGELNWVVCGGESGKNARPFDVQWARETIRHCRAAGVPVFVKQLGRRPFQVVCTDPDVDYWEKEPIKLRDPKGGDISEFPKDLRIREMPEGGWA